jgi:hypothetical protein
MTEVTRYCQIHGYDCGDIVNPDATDPSGGVLGVEEIQVPGKNYADVRNKGRTPKKYKIGARSIDRDLIEDFIEEVNTAPEDSEFYPFDAQRFGLIASAFAGVKSVKTNGNGKVFYEAEAEITCREAWLYGPDKGCPFTTNVALNYVSASLENEGHEPAPISYMQASGDYLSGAYVEDLSLRITPGTSSAEHDREIQLCEKMLRDDIFEWGWRREVIHSWEANMGKSMTELSLDVHGKTSGGSMASEIMTLDNSDYFMIPFYGPLQVAGSPGAVEIELVVSGLTGDGGTVAVANETNLSDIADVVHDDLVIGSNAILLPDMAGSGHVAIGIRAASSGSVSLSGLKGTVKRYVAQSTLPEADPREDFKIRIEKTAGTYLKFLEVCYNDRYWH